MTPDGFPHSGIHGSTPAYGSPWHFAAGRALLRLLAPRHPPYALYILTFLYRFFQRSQNPFCADGARMLLSSNSPRWHLNLNFLITSLPCSPFRASRISLSCCAVFKEHLAFEFPTCFLVLSQSLHSLKLRALSLELRFWWR